MRWPRLTRRRAVLLTILLAAYILFFVNGGCADRLILYATTDPVAMPAGQRREIPFEGGMLEAWVYRSPGATAQRPEALIISFIGNADRAEYHFDDAAAWGELPVEVWAINYPGFGGSSPPAHLDRFPAAADAAYAAAAAEANGRPIIVQGVSLGTTSALYLSARHPIAGVILRTPPPMRQLILGRFGWWNCWLLAWPVARGFPAVFDSLTNAAASSAPAVVLLIDGDEVVPLSYQQRVANAYAGPTRIITHNGRHNDPLSTSASTKLDEAYVWLWQQAVERKDQP